MRDWSTLLAALVGAVLGGGLTWVIGKIQMQDLLRRLVDVLRDRWHVSLEEEFLMTQLLGQRIKTAGYKTDVIFAVSPGGLMIAEWLSRRELGNFRNPVPVRSVCLKSVRSTAGVITEKAVVESDLSALTAGLSKQAKVLLVNDISRGGGTLQVAYDFLKSFFPEDNILTATLFCHRDAATKPRFRVVETDKAVRLDWKEAPSE
jgi:hypoxanthine phosphoribosyltransferase